MTPEEERKLAVILFNRVWELMETDPRTPEENDELIHAAHASRYHWGNVGEPANSARGEWQCSRMYTLLGRADAALWHAQRCLEICTKARHRRLGSRLRVRSACAGACACRRG